ncbi:MAG: ROK family protein [Candidatus Hydrogenedentes bacterium]|nr:ROK family protein [Candidatus Hydrogenedentota bacterium]
MTIPNYVLALEIGGTKLQAALGTSEGEIVLRERGDAPAAGGAEAILAWFDCAVPKLIAEASARGAKVGGIGVGFGGPVETVTGTALVSHQVGGWSGYPLKKYFEDRFGLPTYVGNDANVAGWGEYKCGAGKGTRTFCYMNIGSGIGGAFVINGALLDGQGFGAAEIGHTNIPDWTKDAPGAFDKLEKLCSGWAIEKRLRATAKLEPGTPLHGMCEGDPARITCALLGEAARNGDAFALNAIDEVARGVGIALATVVTLIHPERIAVGGGVSLLGDVLLEPIRRHVDALCFGAYRGKYEIVPCALGEDVVLVGGLLMAAGWKDL